MKISELLAQLLVNPELRKGDVSICTYMLTRTPHWKLRDEALAGWPEWNWRVVYPIEGTGAEWLASKRAGTMWRGKMGRRRRSLLRHLIQWHRERGQ